MLRAHIAILLLLFVISGARAQQKDAKETLRVFDATPFADATHHWYDIFEKSNIVTARPNQPRYEKTDVIGIADNILLYQKNNGGWPKNYDMMAILTDAQKDSLQKAKDQTNTTFDNGTTYTHVTALCRAYTLTQYERYKKAALRGLDFILEAQYKNGGWPQYYPLEENYSRRITFNDGAMLGILQLQKDILAKKPEYVFIPTNYFEKIRKSFRKGIDCILKTQIADDGITTAWCQQYDEVSLTPAWARKFEPPSICNGESSDIVFFLMSIEQPDKAMIDAIEHAVAWFKLTKIYHTRVKVVEAPPVQTAYRLSRTDKIVITDSTAPPIWTRYYELKTHRPLFCNRDSKVVYSLAEVERERRDGYAWYTYAPQKVLDAYEEWRKKVN